MNARGLVLAITGMALGASVWAQQPQGGQAPPTSQTTAPLRVHIYAGLKTHGEGQHDYPQFLADWSKVLTHRGAYVTGGLQFPSARELASTDVMVIYKGDAGYLSMEDRATLDAFIRRGGGLVSLHDALCGPEPEYFASVVGGAKRHGEVNYTLEADVPYTIVATDHPIMQGMSDFTIRDEAFFRMSWSESPAITVLATAKIADTPSAQGQKVVGDAVPQIWAFERSLAPPPTGQPYRAFVWMQGHNYANFEHPDIQGMLLRGISWAGKRPVDALSTVRPQRGGGRGMNPAGRGGRGGQE
jgi:type 1 glutamine amidotransferase